MKTYIGYFILIFLFVACKEKNRVELAQLIEEWQGKEIQFPQKMTFTHLIKDTVDFPFQMSNYRVVVYTDTIGCLSCKLKLNEWNKFITYMDSVTNRNVAFIFLFQSGNNVAVQNALIRYNFNYPVIIDEDDQFYRMNKISSNVNFRAFLLDKNNKILVIGNPIYNLKIKDLYLKIMTGDQNKEGMLLSPTVIETDQVEYDLGVIEHGKTKEILISIHNRGTSIFHLEGFTTSCDCTEVEANWNDLQFGKSESIIVRYKAEQLGEFYRTVEIYGNLRQPITLSFTGIVQ